MVPNSHLHFRKIVRHPARGKNGALRRPRRVQRRTGWHDFHAMQRPVRPLDAGGDIAARCPYQPTLMAAANGKAHPNFTVPKIKSDMVAPVRTARLQSASICPLLLFAPTVLFAQTGSGTSDSIPKLLPPYGQLPPTFWQQHETTILILAIGVFVLLALGLWLWLRPKPVAVVPPEVAARQALEALRPYPEEAGLLGEISRILRTYFIATLDLPPDELTTTEFSAALSRNDRIDDELARDLSQFFRECDERKFSATHVSQPMNALSRALDLLDQAESRRAESRQATADQPATPTNPTLTRA